MKKIWSVALSVVAIVVISGCGGDPISGELKLTVGSKTISESNTEREVVKINNQTKTIVEIKVSDFTCDISLGDKDADQFELDHLNELSFKSKADIFNPKDYDKDNGYELDIKASCDDGRSITYKVEYKVVLGEELLKGHTYYVVNGENNFTEYGFADTKITISDYNITKTSSINYSKVASAAYDATYSDVSFTYNSQTCKLVSSDPLKARCGAKTLEFLKSKPDYVVPSNYYVTAEGSDINNQDSVFLPQIESFKMAGNSPKEGHKVIIKKDKEDKSFSYIVEVNNQTKKLYSQFEDSNRSIHATLGFAETKQLYDCKYLNDTNGISYECEGITLDTNSTGDTKLEIIACDGDADENDTKCSYASLPVLFR